MPRKRFLLSRKTAAQPLRKPTVQFEQPLNRQQRPSTKVQNRSLSRLKPSRNSSKHHRVSTGETLAQTLYRSLTL